MIGLSTATWALMVATLGMTAIASVGCYQALFVFPEYFSAPPASLRRYQSDTSWKFWLPVHVVTLAALVTTLITNGSSNRFGLMLVATACYAAAWIATAIWFIPGVIEFNKVDVDGPASPELAERGRRWQRQSVSRLVLLLAAAVLLTISLGG
ncbi:hypothetical protein O7626_16455 [Micromonospora sp. WMMD1102]|uniref:hypothetical protein n=1 Tax=Micromonospora sp. WMMD1102 TaxID=3016105 RepID=UPI00241557F7|nr:hypothetical protein [Micromonospora sp. WMMD1102]MDG4787506.1 hypothetical protein [Micromonospora sp. WMMD1102]